MRVTFKLLLLSTVYRGPTTLKRLHLPARSPA